MQSVISNAALCSRAYEGLNSSIIVHSFSQPLASRFIHRMLATRSDPREAIAMDTIALSRVVQNAKSRTQDYASQSGRPLNKLGLVRGCWISFFRGINATLVPDASSSLTIKKVNVRALIDGTSIF